MAKDKAVVTSLFQDLQYLPTGVQHICKRNVTSNSCVH
jgi:hypothetical protein